jgi:uncharacterized repeat protein (TIGR01451 family)
MKTGNVPRRFVTRLNSLMLVGVFVILAAVVAVPFYTVRSNSLLTRGSQAGNKSGASERIGRPASHARWSSTITPFSPDPQPFIESIATYDGATCTTPQTDFQINDVVCAKATGVPPTLFPWHVAWVDPAGLIQQADIASTDDQAQYHFTPTSIGPWRVNLLRSNGAVRQTAAFTVHDTANVTADVFVQKFVHSDSASVPAGNDISFTVVVANAGPDSAAAVHLIDAVPSGLSLVSFTQQSGPTCVPSEVGPNDCTIATMANGDRAEFTAIYNTGTAAQGDYQTSATATSTTNDSNTDNNTGTAQFSITAPASTASCQVVCPENINAVANTTEGGQRGAHVTYDDPTSTGTCGSLSSTPVSGSFFPVGTTVVTATSETGGGSCTFVITVDDTGTNPPTISCPASQTVNADNSCAATVTLGNPTTGGDNVTVHATRSDGLAMYDCDTNGNNCVRKTTDLPFPTGVTSVVWMATAHDTPGGNETGTASCTQTITVVDVTPPTITAANQTASADANCQAPVPNFSTIASVSDNCACASSDTSQICDSRQDIRVTQDVAPGTLVGLGPHTITLTANDGSSNNGGAGNTATVQVTFTVNDTTAPTIHCPADILNVHTDPGTCSATINPGTATASDNCSTPTIVGVRSDAQALTASYPKGTTTITWTATDAAGNHSSCVQTITVIDVEPPTISCPTDMIVDFNAAGTAVTFTPPVGTDNCAGATTAQTAGLASGSIYPLGTTTNTFTVTDASGNTASCSFKVTVALTSLIGLDSVTISGSGYADSYSSAGGYPATKGSLADILSNGTITIGGSGKVWGNVRSTRTNVNMTGSAQVTGNATAGTTVTTSGSATVLGTRTNNALAPVMTLPSVPACSPFSSNSGITGTYTYNAGTGDLTLSGVNIATLANGNYCFHNITLGNSGQLKVNGPVVIKLTGTLNTSGATNLNNTTQIPSNLQILSSYSGSNGVVIGNSVSVYALIYAPQTGLNMSGSAPLLGTFAGKTLTIGNSGAIHYDTQLKSVWPAVWTLIFGP